MSSKASPQGGESSGPKQWSNPRRPNWGRGPWDGEPDKKQWIDDATGLDCLAVRNQAMGFWCGYVGVPASHPWFGKDYSEVEADVHGGLTFSGGCVTKGRDVWESICHDGREDVHWFGFDCGHIGDMILRESNDPCARIFAAIDSGSRHDEYRTLAYVESQCARLAEQIREACE